MLFALLTKFQRTSKLGNHCTNQEFEIWTWKLYHLEPFSQIQLIHYPDNPLHSPLHLITARVTRPCTSFKMSAPPAIFGKSSWCHRIYLANVET
jgi:hypothetical protein